MSSKTYASNVSLSPVYLSARSAIIVPERAIPVTIYGLRKWLPRLGPERWALVQLIRGLCYDGDRRPDGTKRVTTSWKLLGEMLQVHEETIASWLKHKPIPEDKPWRRIVPTDDYSEFLSIFIPRLRYAYETRSGKTRRVGFLLEVLMEDPIAPEDEVQLAQQEALMRYEQTSLGINEPPLQSDVNPVQANSPQSNTKNITKVSITQADLESNSHQDIDRLTNPRVNPSNSDLAPSVKQYYVNSQDNVSTESTDLHYGKSDSIGDNVNKLESLFNSLKQIKHHRRNFLQILEPIIILTEDLLEDHHSTKMLYKVLRVLFPDNTDIYIAAVEEALSAHATESTINKGAIFVNSLRELADAANIDLGFKSSASQTQERVTTPETMSGDPLVAKPAEFLGTIEDAIWSETLSKLEGQMLKGTFNSIMQGTRLLGLDGETYIVQVSTPLAKDWLDNRWRSTVEQALASVVGASVTAKVDFRLR